MAGLIYIVVAVFTINGVFGQIKDNCLGCICGVESNGDRFGCGTLYGGGTGGCAAGCNWDVNSCSCGPYQIKQAYFTDCSASYLPALSIKTWVGCATNLSCAKQCVKNYMQRYGTPCTGKPLSQVTCPEFAGMHNGGPGGCRSSGTLTYRNLVSRCCSTAGSC